MKKKIVLYTTLISVAACVLVFALGIVVTRSDNYEQAESNVKSTTEMFSKLYDGDLSIVHAVSADVRLTIISANGTVLADSSYSDVSGLENHISREEVLSALNGNPKAVIRTSDTSGQKMIYYALKTQFADDYVFIRVSVPVEGVNGYVIKTIPLMVAILLFAVLCAVILSIILSGKIVQPLNLVKKSLSDINDGKFRKTMPTQKDEEINAIVRDINDLGEKVEESIRELKQEREKLDCVINNINDGIVALKNSDICLINNRVKQIFRCTDTVVGQNVNALTDNKDFIDAFSGIGAAKDGTNTEIKLNGGVYYVTVKNIGDDSGLSPYTVIVLTDVTIARGNEKMRGEFFANASHELKTPLTTIKGFNELIQLEDKDNKLNKFTSQISVNTDRMLSLVDDMLNLSSLENTSKPLCVRVDAAEVARAVKDDLSMLAQAKNVTVDVEGEGILYAEHKHVYELIKNLAENAVKYNKDGGRVAIKVSETEGKTEIKVCDDGIGIDKKHQLRIFERFYRVEKSRSRATGGTGLGLAIVKHISLLYGAELFLQSKPGEGTTVGVVFENQKFL